MKEKDLEKCLDNLIIKGLIQEAEQDNAEFEAAMRMMSDEDFLALIYDTAEEPARASISAEKEIFLNETPPTANAQHRILLRKANRLSDEWNEWDAPASLNKAKATMRENKGWKIWAAAIASVAAILLIVFIPAYMDMNSRLCESALLASSEFTTPSRGLDISSMTKGEVNDMLDELEARYAASIQQNNGILSKQSQENDNDSYYFERLNLQEAGMDLVQAYLKLGKKDKAVEVLLELEANIDDPDFREYCKKMLEILE